MGQRTSLRQSNVHPFVPNAPRSEDRVHRISPEAEIRALAKAQSGPGPEDRARAEIDLLALLAHQLITPLAHIDTAAQKMARHADAMDAAEIGARANRIRSATRRLSTLAHALLNRARLDQNRDFAREACSVADLIARACEPVRQAQPGRQFRIDVQADRLVGDPLLLEQLLAVLVCNAAKYSAPDTVIGITAMEDAAGMTLTVSDQGIGIAPEDRNRLFEPCFRGRNAAGVHGTGMGLHLASRIAELHGGRILAESREGEGSTFTVELPRA